MGLSCCRLLKVKNIISVTFFFVFSSSYMSLPADTGLVFVVLRLFRVCWIILFPSIFLACGTKSIKTGTRGLLLLVLACGLLYT